MATHDLPILGANTLPDTSGKAFFEPLGSATALGTADWNAMVLTMQAPATAGDLGCYGKFTIPQNYVDTPILVIRGVLGEAANTLGFGFQQVAVAHAETVEIVLEAEDIANNATWTGLAAEEMYEETITITPGASYTVGDEVFFYFFREDTNDDQTGEFWLTGLFFRYNDA